MREKISCMPATWSSASRPLLSRRYMRTPLGKAALITDLALSIIGKGIILHLYRINIPTWLRCRNQFRLRPPLPVTGQEDAYIARPSNGSGGAHPGHEVRLHGWLEMVRPEVFILTDGSGATGQSRLNATTTLL